MKRLVLCFDGTWNALADPTKVTNVVKIAKSVKFTASDGTPQITYYNSGVGSGGPVDRFLGGAFGVGLRSNVKRGLPRAQLRAVHIAARERRDLYFRLLARSLYGARARRRRRRRRHPEKY